MTPSATTGQVQQAIPSPDEWRRVVAPYEGADDARAWRAFATSLPPFIVTWYLMYRALGVSYWLTVALSFVAGGFVVRTFIVQHDCGHGSFFRSSRLNVATGRICSLVTLLPYGYFRRYHAAHHATAGKLHDRGVDVETLTVREYLALSPARKLRYRFLRHPLVLFGIVPLFYFVIGMRMPVFAHSQTPRERRSIYLTDIGLVLAIAVVGSLVGFRNFLLVQLPVTLIASTAGMWLFYVQHQFEDTYWADGDDWDFSRAALEGSSYYALPSVLQWFTGYIGLHHVHHLSVKVPSYRLVDCHEGNAVLARVPKLTFRDALGTMHLKLWDEDARRLTGWPS